MPHSAEPIDEAEVVVVGAGPAGSSCAAHLAARGHDVLLVDQSAFPRDKPCGDGLTRAAAAGLDRLGLSSLLRDRPSIEGLRMVFGYRSSEYRRYEASPGGGHQAYCIERRVLDSALLDLALERGVRFREARATSMVPGERPTVLVTSRAEPGEAAIRSRFLVAADGSTSRLARQLGRSRRTETAGAYAVRAYYRCERELDPVFNAYMPLELGDLRFPGYGWVFPIDRHTANIGVGYWRGHGVTSPKRIRDVMTAFVEQLRIRERSRYGDIEGLSKLFGAPLGVQFDPGRCEAPGVVMIGDAARTTDPVSGEGIAYALHGAEMIAEMVHARARGGLGAGGADLGAGRALARRFPRLGQDVGLPLRMADRRRHQVDDYQQKTSAHPFVRTMRNIVTSPEDSPRLVESIAGSVLRDGPERAWLEQLDDVVLDTVATSFPVAAELLHSEVRRGVGPVLSVAAALTRNGGGDDPRLISAAAAVELVRAGTNVAREVADRPTTRGGQANNALCLLVGDFALSRASRHAAAAGPAFAAATGRAIQSICDAQFVESRSLFDPAREPGAVIDTARARMSTLLELSLRFAGECSHMPPHEVEGLVAYGRELGVAVRLVEDLAILVDGDESTNRPAGTELTLGVYPLPVLWALADDPSLRDLLDDPDVLDRNDEVVARASATGALERAADEVALYVGRAGRALPAGAPAGLAELAGAIAEHARALLPACVP
jgi:geranylgeranyl reductase family protein